MEEGQIGGWDTVKVDHWVGPWVIEVWHFETRLFIRDDRRTDEILLAVFAVVEASAEQCDAHDAEHQPEDEAHKQHVENGGDRLHESVHDNLQLLQRTVVAVTEGWTFTQFSKNRHFSENFRISTNTMATFSDKFLNLTPSSGGNKN